MFIFFDEKWIDIVGGYFCCMLYFVNYCIMWCSLGEVIYFVIEESVRINGSVFWCVFKVCK